jgi:dolichol-phosphate mannosyltransferase
VRCCVVLPAHNEEAHIADTLRTVPRWIDGIVVVDDGSSDQTRELASGIADSRVRVLSHEENQGVGAAMRTGYRAALRDGYDVIVKMDADGQMDATELWKLVRPLALGLAEYTKGNRFRIAGQPPGMPRTRWLGNVSLSFLNKVATGYWHVFDPQCGFTAIQSGTLRMIDLERLVSDYFFENDMLARLNVVGARVVEVATATRYGDEVSGVSVRRALWSFPRRLLGRFVWRFAKRHLVWDFGVIGALVIVGLVLLTFGVVFGGYHWWQSLATGTPATAGTVMIAVLPIIIAIQMLLQALALEVQDSPGAEETRVYTRLLASGDESPEPGGPK